MARMSIKNGGGQLRGVSKVLAYTHIPLDDVSATLMAITEFL